MNIFLQLQADHRRQRKLAGKLLQPSTPVEARCALLERLCAEIEAHAAAEEQTLYAELLSHPDARISERVAEHDGADELLLQLREMDRDSPEWAAAFKAFADALERHLQAEESELLPLCRTVVGDDRAEVLGDRFERCKRRETAVWSSAIAAEPEALGLWSPAPSVELCAREDKGSRRLKMTNRAGRSWRPRVLAERGR